MKKYLLYDENYIKSLEKSLSRTKIIAYFLISLTLIYAIFSLLMSSNENNQWLLYINIPLDILVCLIMLAIIQVYLPSYRWEHRLAISANQAETRHTRGIIEEVETGFTSYDGQKMIAIHVNDSERVRIMYIRPWFFNEGVQIGKSYDFVTVSQVIVAYKEGEL